MAKYERKNRHPFERAVTELVTAVFSLTPAPKPAIPPAPTTSASNQMTVPMLNRILNHLAHQNARHAYIWVLTVWLKYNSIDVPEGIFALNLAQPEDRRGLRPRKTAERLDLGGKAWVLQFTHRLGGEGRTKLETRLSNPLTRADAEREIHEALDAVFKQKGVLGPSALAQKLIPHIYARKPDAARKRIQEALRMALPTPERLAEVVLAETSLEQLVKDWLIGRL